MKDGFVPASERVRKSKSSSGLTGVESAHRRERQFGKFQSTSEDSRRVLLLAQIKSSQGVI